MAEIHITAMLISASQSYSFNLDQQVTVGAIARYLSQAEGYVNASTLEVARPVAMGQKLRDVDLQTGDRLLIFTQPAIPQRPPERMNPGDKILRFTRGDYSFSSRGKRGLLVGKPDASHQTMPDIDMRYFVSPEMLDYVSRGCLWLNFDEGRQVWYASKLGETRVMIDDFELVGDKIALDGGRSIRFYRPMDTPFSHQPIGEIRVEVEEVAGQAGLTYLKDGQIPARVHLGIEREAQTLNATDSVSIGQVVTSLALYHKAPLNDDTRPYIVRLLPPAMPVHTLSLSANEFLYVARSVQYAQNILTLSDAHSGKTYALRAGLEDDTRRIGCRVDALVEEPQLDVDLFEAIVDYHHHDADVLLHLRDSGHIDYRAGENAWFIRLHENARLPIYVNNTRITTNIPTRLISGDVLSFGHSVTDYYARLSVAVVTR